MELQALLRRLPLLETDTPAGRVQYRAAGSGASVTHVLLHGIGSASASWVRQLQAADKRPDLRLLAWDAPGYGESDPLPPSSPDATDYAQSMWAWLDALGVRSTLTLVGHSWGALIAARAALLAPARVQRLVLLSPARGYGEASQEERREKLESRLASLRELGPEGMAASRSARMLSASASDEELAAVRATMAQIRPAGYEQAARMLSTGVLLRDLPQLDCPVSVASGEADVITTPSSCDLVAAAAGVKRISLGQVGHACALEAAQEVNGLLGLA